MSTEEHITQLTAQVAALQAQLACHSQSPPPPQPSAAPVPTPKPQLEPPLEPRDTVYAILLTLEWEEHICTTSTPSQRLAEEAQAQ